MKNTFLILAIAAIAVIPRGNESYTFKAPPENSCKTVQFCMRPAKVHSLQANKCFLAEVKISLSKTTRFNLADNLFLDSGPDLKSLQDYPAIQALESVIKTIRGVFDGRKSSAPHDWTSCCDDGNNTLSCRKNVIPRFGNSVLTLPVRL